jgi:hypothetical protein
MESYITRTSGTQAPHLVPPRTEVWAKRAHMKWAISNESLRQPDFPPQAWLSLKNFWTIYFAYAQAPVYRTQTYPSRSPRRDLPGGPAAVRQTSSSAPSPPSTLGLPKSSYEPQFTNATWSPSGLCSLLSRLRWLTHLCPSCFCACAILRRGAADKFASAD